MIIVLVQAILEKEYRREQMANAPKTDKEIEQWLHYQARRTGNTLFNTVADRFAELSKAKEEKQG